jgi:cell division protein FtsB
VSDTQILVAAVVGLLAFIGTIGTAVLGSRQKGLADLVTSLQAEVEALRAEARNADIRIAKLETRDRAWADYVHLLRAHITDGKPAPPPPWPVGLDR